jgi:Fe-S cluster biosynthesis and repair protein YggX
MSDSENTGGNEAFVCTRCGKANPPLDEPPFPNELGRNVQRGICEDCWRQWVALSVRIVNEYRLDLMRPEASAAYDRHMCDFLGIDP